MINPSLESAVQKLWISVNSSAEILKSTRNENRTLSSSLQQAVKDKDIVLDELRRTRDEMTKLKHELDIVSAKVRSHNELEEQYLALELQADDNATKLSQTLEKLSALSSENVDLKKQVDELTISVSAKETIVKRTESLEAENAHLSQKLNEMLEFEKNLEIMRKELARKNADVNNHLNEIQRLKNERAEVDNKLFDLPKQREEIASLKAVIEELTEEKNTLLQTHEEAKEYSRLHKIQQESIDSYTQQILDLKRINSHLEADKHDRDRQIESLQRKIDEQIMVQERLHLQLRSAREYETQIAEQLRSLDDYSAQLIESQKTITLRDEELVVSRTNERELQQLVQKEQQSVWLLTEKLNAVNSSYEKLLVELSEIKHDRESSISELESLREKTLVTEEQIRKNESALKELQNTITQLQTEKSDLQQSIADVMQIRSTLDAKIAAQEVELTSLYDKIKLSENNSHELQTLIQSLKDEVSDLQASLEQNHNSYERGKTELTRTIAELEVLNNSLVSKIHTLEQELSQTKEALLNASSDLDVQQREREEAAQNQTHLLDRLKDDYRQNEESLQLRIREFETRLRAQELLFDQVSNEKTTLEHQNRSIIEALQQITEERDEYLAQISDLVGEKNNSQERTTVTIERLQKDYAQEKSRNDEAKEEIEELKIQIQSLVKQVEEESTNSSRLKEQMIHLTRERSSDELLLHQKEKSIQELTTKIASLTSSLSQYVQHGNESSLGQLTIGDEETETHNELSVTKRKMSLLQDELNFIKSEKKSALAQVSSLADQLKVISEKMNKQEATLQELHQENTLLKQSQLLKQETVTVSDNEDKNARLAESIRVTLERLEKYL